MSGIQMSSIHDSTGASRHSQIRLTITVTARIALPIATNTRPNQ